MSQISQPEAADLLEKLLSERIRLQAFFVSAFKSELSMFGFVDSITRANGLVISESGPPIDVSRGYLSFQPFDVACEFWYGEKRELPEEIRRTIPDSRGDSTLLFNRTDTGERLALFFKL